ncbi:MAG: ComEC family competence protein [Rhodospirillales bacterium]|nr:MAG: ComEC family competence protein [Rhodospirillales bacterium]
MRAAIRLARAVRAVLAAERDRWLLWLPAGVGVGIGAYFALPDEPPLWLGPMPLALALCGIAGARALGERGRVPALAALVSAAVVLAGFAAAQVRTATVAAPVLERRIGPVAIAGRIVTVEVLPSAWRLTLNAVSVADLAPERTPQAVRVRVQGAQPAFRPGDRVTMRGVLMPPPPPSAPGAFDFQRQSYFRGLGGVGFAYGTVTVAEPNPEPAAWALALERTRQRVGDRIRAHLDGATAAVAVALVIGERGGIPPPVMTDIRESGLAHLLAISGLHVGLVAGLVFGVVRGGLALVRPVALRFPIKKWAAVAAALAAIGYAALAGWPIPTQRALLMIGLVLLAVVLDRRGLSMRSVAWAALVILLLTPESLLSASFQLSFAAVVALIAVYEEVREWRRRHRREAPSLPERFLFYLGGVALTTVVASAATAPFAVFHFHYLAGYGLAANMVAVPVTAFWVMPMAVAALALMPLGLEAVPLSAMAVGIDVVLAVAEAVANWPGAVMRLPAAPLAGLVAAVVGGLWLCLWRTRWRFLGAVGIIAGALSLSLVRPPDLLIDGEARLLALRTADGDLVLSSQRTNRFAQDVWLRRAGLERIGGGWPLQGGNSADGALACDPLGCIWRRQGRVVAIAWSPEGLAEDCRHADVVVSVVPIRLPCPAPVRTIDRFDVWRNGAHALWLDGATVRVESVGERQGRRPWSVLAQRRRDR